MNLHDFVLGKTMVTHTKDKLLLEATLKMMMKNVAYFKLTWINIHQNDFFMN